MHATSPDPRLYPAHPLLAVSIATFRGDRVLLMTRARAPATDVSTLPGGLVEVGESLEDACLRELLEETGVRAEIVGFNDHVAVVERDAAGAVRRHYLIATFAGRWLAGEARPSEEAATLEWVGPDEWAKRRLSPGLDRLLARARRIVEGNGP